MRAWWLFTIALLFVVGSLFVQQLVAARRGQFRVDHWTLVPAARIDKIGTTTREQYRIAPEDLSYNVVKLSYLDASGKMQMLEGILEAQTEPIHPGQTIKVLVDPSEPSRWTDRVKPVPLVEELMVPLLMLPLLVLFAVLAVWQRYRTLKLWRTGLRREAIVLDRRNSATSPRSSIVRCTIEGRGEKRVLQVTVPRSVAQLEPGDTITLITPPGNSARAIAAVLYE